MEKANVLVTGGAGFIGSYLVEGLLAAGYRVRVLDALVPQVHGDHEQPFYLDRRAEFVHANITDEAAVNAALEGIEIVFHEAAEVGVGQSMYKIQRYVHANDYGTAVLLEAIIARRPQIRKIIVASSMSIYGEGAYWCQSCGEVYPHLRPTPQLLDRRWEVDCPRCAVPVIPKGTPESKPLFPTSVYAVTKQDQEQFCLVVGRSYSIPTVALRYFNVYGPRQALSNPYTGVCAIFSGRLLNGHAPLIFEDGEQTRDFVHVTDIARANLLALETDKANYRAVNIGTARATSVKEVARLLATGLGEQLEPQIVGKYREGDVRHCVADISLARSLLGYEPRVSLEQGIPQFLSWVKQQAAKDQVDHATAELESRQLVR